MMNKDRNNLLTDCSNFPLMQAFLLASLAKVTEIKRYRNYINGKFIVCITCNAKQQTNTNDYTGLQNLMLREIFLENNTISAYFLKY